MKNYYNIVLNDQPTFCLAACSSLEIAKKRLKEIKENDCFLSKYYKWDKMPKYKIIKGAKM